MCIFLVPDYALLRVWREINRLFRAMLSHGASISYPNVPMSTM